MGIVYLLMMSILCSFSGTCAKIISPYFDTEYISLFRFVFGVFFLFLLKVITKHHFSEDYKDALREYYPWLIFGAAGKELAYLTENYALARGLSYGNIITQPAQMVFLTIISVAMFKEKLTKKQTFFLIFCLVGVILVSWNGRDLSDFLNNNLLFTVLFVVSGVFSGCHVLAQKKVAGKMDVIDSNITMFSIAALLALVPAIPPTTNGKLVGVYPDTLCRVAIPFMGFITGIGFFLNAKAVELVPLYIVPVIQSSIVMFSIVWGVVFFHEHVTAFVVVGAMIFVIGIIGIQICEIKNNMNTCKNKV